MIIRIRKWIQSLLYIIAYRPPVSAYEDAQLPYICAKTVISEDRYYMDKSRLISILLAWYGKSCDSDLDIQKGTTLMSNSLLLLV